MTLNKKKKERHHISGMGGFLKNNRTYISWISMKVRCDKSNRNGSHLYKDRGITYCKRWSLFKNFLEDMGERPKDTSLDRIDTNGNYYPENCRWATQKEQCRNKRTNKNFTFNGKTQCVAEWADELGMNYFTLLYRLTIYNWSVEKALTTPVRPRRT